MKLHHTIILTAILATVLVFLCLFIAAGAPKRYSVDYGGAKGLFNKAKDSYREGEKVTMYFDLIATDTDYSFFIDGAVAGNYLKRRGYKHRTHNGGIFSEGIAYLQTIAKGTILGNSYLVKYLRADEGVGEYFKKSKRYRRGMEVFSEKLCIGVAVR